jgi:hypothetical protein
VWLPLSRQEQRELVLVNDFLTPRGDVVPSGECPNCIECSSELESFASLEEFHFEKKMAIGQTREIVMRENCVS